MARDIVQLPVARDLYLRCVAEDPGFAPAWARLGRVERMIGKYLDIPAFAAHLARAEDALRRALELSPELPLVQKLYAQLESEIGRAQEAMVRLLRLARDTRNDAELFAGLVHVCRYSGLYEASVAAHREAQRLDPHLPTGVVHTLWQQGDFEGVLEQCGQRGRSVARLRPPRAGPPGRGHRRVGPSREHPHAPDSPGPGLARRRARVPEPCPR